MELRVPHLDRQKQTHSSTIPLGVIQSNYKVQGITNGVNVLYRTLMIQLRKNANKFTTQVQEETIPATKTESIVSTPKK